MSRNFMKKTLAGIFALVIVASSTPIAPFVTVMDSNSITASAAEVTADGLEYEVNEDGNAITITGYSGTSSDVVIPSKIEDVPVTAIGNDVFYRNNTIINVTIPDSVTSIGEYAFFESYLENVNIPNTVTSIGAHAFHGTFITDLVIPDSLESISEFTFTNCRWLKNVTLPVSVKSIGDTAFESCPALTNVKYAGSLADWCSISIDRGNGPLTNAKITLSQGEQIICGSTLIWTLDDNGVLTIKGDDEVFPEFWVDNKAVEWCDKKENVKKVVFDTPNLTTLGSGAFFKFVNLESIDLPDSLTTINQVAFYTCSALKNITLPDSLTVISKGIFYDCTSLTAINIPDTVTIIGDNVFSGCPLSEITIPDTVTSIGNYAFYNTNLTEITIPNSVKSLGYCAFQKCSSLSEVTLPDSLTIIPSSIFANCTSLESITIPDSVAEIYYGAFLGCSSLSDITIPDSVTLIDEFAFGRCKNLTSITIPDSVTSIVKYAFYESGLTEITIPDSVKSIGVGVFDDCTSLTSITASCSLKDSMADARGNCTADITYMHHCTKSAEYTYKVKCACGDTDLDYTDVHVLLANEQDFLNNLNQDDYTEDSWKALYDSVTALAEIVFNFEENVFVSAQSELTAVISAYSTAKTGLVLKDADYSAVDAAIDTVAATDRDAYTAASLNALDAAVAAVERDLDITRQDEVDAMAKAIEDAIAALEEKPKYDTLYEEYLVTAPTVTEAGTYNKRAYHYENDAKVVDTEKVFAEDKAVTFEQWYLRTLIQYQTNGNEFDLRFVSMLDENLDQYQKAGFIFTINGTEVSDELSTTVANTSYIVDGKEVNISAFSQPDDYFFLQKYVFDIGEIDLDATLTVTAYVVLADGTELRGTKAVTFTLRQFEG